MNPYDEYGQTPSRPSAPLGQRITRALGVGSSVLVVGVFAWWAFHLGSRDASKVPVIAGMEGEIRTLPEDGGGSTVDFQGNEVNSVLEGNTPQLPNTIAIAPGEEGVNTVEPADPNLVEVNVTPTEGGEVPTDENGQPLETVSIGQTAGLDTTGFVANTDMAEVISPALRPELLYIPAQDQLNPATIEARPVGSTDVAPNEPVETATALVEGDNPGEAEEEPEATAETTDEGNEDLGPRLPSGSPLIQLAAYPTLEDTKKQWEKLRASEADVLAGKQLYIEKKTVNGKLWYRLRVSGFADTTETKDACATLLERGLQCIVVRSE